MDEAATIFEKIIEVCRHLFSSQELMDTLKKPGFMLAAFLVINLVVFVETGLLVGFFLPGDSLLVTAGLVCFHSHWNLPLLLITLSLAAIIGDTVGYTIGWRTGPKIFNRQKSVLFARDHLLKAQAFYQRHGGKTIILARFMPIIRTFAPVVAGVGGMRYRKFLFYNILGGIGWVCSMVLTGYYLTRLLDPLLQPVLGANFRIQDHIEKVIVVVVLLSISPPFFVWLRHKLGAKVTPPPADTLASAPVAAGEP
jgi:membrane-associated protein